MRIKGKKRKSARETKKRTKVRKKENESEIK
jgi:hypothetical protein